MGNKRPLSLLGKKRLNSHRMGVIMLLPALFLFAALQLYPFFYGVSMSFTDYFLMTKKEPNFVGLKNYIDIFTKDPRFWPSLKFSFIYTLSIVIFSYIIGMIFAVLLNKPLKGRGVFRALVLIPWFVSSSVMATNWKFLMNDRYGLINDVLQTLGLIEKPLLFFSTPDMARLSVTLIGIWRNIPFMAIMLLSGMQSIPTELYEAGEVDGASGWQKFWYITVPQLRGVTLMSTTMMFIWALNGFENIYLLTGGGPLDSTSVVAIYSYLTAFDSSKMGYAAALSTILMIIMVIFSMIRLKLNSKYED